MAGWGPGFQEVLRIRIGFNADTGTEPTFFVNENPDPDPEPDF
jgi:hypothetical protein